MKILSIVGSPRVNGNTHFLSQKFCEGAQGLGCEAEEVILNQKDIHGCIHCDGCLEDGVCVLKDDQAEVIDKMRAADAFLLSSPVYCFSVTAQMKAFMDRTWSMCRPTWVTGVEGKPVFFIVGSAAPPREGDPNFKVNHKMTVDTFLRVAKAAKLAQGSVPVRDAIDPMVPFDPCADTLRILYQVSCILGMEPMGCIVADGLGHDKTTVRSRPEEIERAMMSGTRFAAMARMLKEKAFM